MTVDQNHKANDLSLQRTLGWPRFRQLEIARLQSRRPVLRRVAEHHVVVVDLSAIAGAWLIVAQPWRHALVYGLAAWLFLRVTTRAEPLLVPRAGPDLPAVLTAAAVPLLFVAALPGAHDEDLAQAVLTAALIISGRVAACAVFRQLRRRRHLVDRTLVVGAGAVGVELCRIFASHAEFGVEVIGLLDTVNDDGLPVPLLGAPGDLVRITRGFNIDRVVVAYGRDPVVNLLPLLRQCRNLAVPVNLVPRFFELGVDLPTSRAEDVWGIPLLQLRRSQSIKAARLLKRTTDLALATALLALLAPLLLVCAAAVRLTSRGPVFFRQERLGLDGRAILIHKFRSMRVNGDSDSTWSVAADRRVTRVGRLLRRTSLDELPQLFDVITGRLSLVGPRPERPHFVQLFSATVPGYAERLRAPAGVTGWAQVHGLRGDTSIIDRARFDNNYIENWSPVRDLVILARTITALVRHRGD